MRLILKINSISRYRHNYKTITATLADATTVTANFTDLSGGTPDGSETIVTSGTNVTVTGTGTEVNPYVVNSSGGGSAEVKQTTYNRSNSNSR